MESDGTHLWLVVWKTYDALHKQATRSIDSLDMCVTDFGILELLLHKGPRTINHIGEKVSLASGSVTAAIDRLEKRGLLERIPSPTDRRAKLVKLTETGRSLISAAFEVHTRHMNEATAVLTPGETSTLIDLLKKVGKYAAACEVPLPGVQTQIKERSNEEV